MRSRGVRAAYRRRRLRRSRGTTEARALPVCARRDCTGLDRMQCGRVEVPPQLHVNPTDRDCSRPDCVSCRRQVMLQDQLSFQPNRRRRAVQQIAIEIVGAKPPQRTFAGPLHPIAAPIRRHELGHDEQRLARVRRDRFADDSSERPSLFISAVSMCVMPRSIPRRSASRSGSGHVPCPMTETSLPVEPKRRRCIAWMSCNRIPQSLQCRFSIVILVDALRGNRSAHCRRVSARFRRR